MFTAHRLLDCIMIFKTLKNKIELKGTMFKSSFTDLKGVTFMFSYNIFRIFLYQDEMRGIGE